MAFMRAVFYAHSARQPRHRRSGKVDPGYGPKLIGAILTDGSVVVVNVEESEWYEKSSAVPSADIIGTCYRCEPTAKPDPAHDGKWFAEFQMPNGGTHVVKDDYGRTAFQSAADAGLACLAQRNKTMVEELRILADPVANLTRELKCHDWYCAMSDAPGVCGAGEAHMRRIRKIMEDVDPVKVRELWAKHAPADFTCPV